MTMLDVRQDDLTDELRTMNRAQLDALAGSAMGDDARAELRRRDDLDRARDRRRADPVTREWHDASHAQFLAAEAATRGYLLNARGVAGGIDPWSLWAGPMGQAERYASWELLRFWEASPRITITEYRDQSRTDREGELNDYLDRHDAGGVRPGAGAGPESTRGDSDGTGHAVPAPDAGDSAEAQDDPGARADGRGSSPVRPAVSEPWRPVVVTEASPVTVIPGPDPVEAARARLAQRAAELAAERAERPVAAPACRIPALEPVSPAAVALRPSGTVSATSRRAGVDGARALSLTAMYLRYYAGMPGEARRGEDRPVTLATADAVALWAAHAVARGADGAEGRKGTLIWNASPRLLLTSKVNGSGKSSVLDLLASLCHCEFGRQSRVSGPAFAALMGDHRETALLDEAKKIFGAGKAAQELQSHILNGYTRNGKSLVMRGGKLSPSVVWGPVAYAGKDELITDTRDDLADLLARSIVIGMGRPDRYYPEIGATAHGEGLTLGAALAAWATQERTTLLARADELARETEGLAVTPDKAPRGAQLWRPLLAIADVAGMASQERDGHGDECGCPDCTWPERAREACAMLSGTAATDEDAHAMQEFAGLEGKFGTLSEWAS